jgi:hypothetical protein
MRPKQPIDRFMEKVVKRIDKPFMLCWIWTGYKNHKGYGQFRDPGHPVIAHRWSYEHFIGPIPEGMQLDHFKCHNPSCVNPYHVRPATALENIRNALTHNSVKTHCKRGHEFTPENTRILKGNRRMCRTCSREWEGNNRYKYRKSPRSNETKG